MSFDPDQPYGRPLETTLRVLTWNVWGRFGPWEARQAAIRSCLRGARPDLVALQETWSTDDASQAAELAKELDFSFVEIRGRDFGGFRSGAALLSRWPIARHEELALGAHGDGEGGLLLSAGVEGPRGPIQLFAAMLDWRPDVSHVRQAQVREIAQHVRENGDLVAPALLCGDFNAPPESDEIRSLTGRSRVAVRRMVFQDAWESAGDGGAGHTWSNANPHAAVGMLPSARIDYVFSAWPRARAAGHPVHCERVGTGPVDGVWASDHFGVLADVRY